MKHLLPPSPATRRPAPPGGGFPSLRSVLPGSVIVPELRYLIEWGPRIPGARTESLLDPDRAASWTRRVVLR